SALRKRLIVLGSSTAKAYRPEILRVATGFDEVDNLALDSSNVTQIHQLFADVKSCFGEKALHSSTILFVTSYMMFGDYNRFYQHYTHYEEEKIRHGLYRGEPNALVPTLRPYWMPLVITILRPVFAVYTVKYDLAWLGLETK